MPSRFKNLKSRATAAASKAGTAAAAGIAKAHEVARNEDGEREKLALKARAGAEAAKAKLSAVRSSDGAAQKPPSPSSAAGGPVAAFAAMEDVPAREVGKTMSDWGFLPHRPVALFNSLSGCQTEVVTSKFVRRWEGKVLWVEPTKLTEAATSNLASGAAGTKSAHKDEAWREKLYLEMDADRDGTVDPGEIAAFCESHDGLCNDPIVKAAVASHREKEHSEGSPASSSSIIKRRDSLLDALRPVRAKLMAALIDERSHHDEMSLQTSEHRQGSTQWTRHMQLVDGWRDPDGIKVRAKKGLAAMECLVANDKTGLAAKLGAGLMIGVTSQLRAVGYEEGTDLLACGYDWRAPCTRLEERDGHFSKLMDDLEKLVDSNGGKAAVVVTHSLGGVCAHYFFQWVAHSDKGRARGGAGWLDKHVHSFVPIGGPMLGTPFGSHSYLTGNEGEGIAPLLVSYADRHLLIRSWGMFGMIFPTGRHLILQPTKSPHWVRREGILRVHVLRAKVPDNYWSLAETGSHAERGHFVHLTLKPPGVELTVSKLKTLTRKMSTEAAFDEQFQFAWATTPYAVDGASLTVSLHRLQKAGVKNVLMGDVDEQVAHGTFHLGCSDHLTKDPGPCESLVPGKWSDHALKLDGGVLVTVRLCFQPHALEGFDHDFTRAAAGDDGAWRCGGPADDGSSIEKWRRMVDELGSEEGAEWVPVAASDARMTKRDAEKHKCATYDPVRIDQAMVLDGMKHEYECWQESYADDPIWRQYATEAPPVRRVWPLYGINVPTLIGSVFRHRTKRYRWDEPATGLKLDKHCKVEHPCYDIKNGVVKEVPHKTPQVDDPTVPLEQMTYRTRASGDGTVAYWSLRWPVAWRGAGNIDVDDPLEVEGAGHRDILEKPACIAAVLSECCSRPSHFVNVALVDIVAPDHPSDKRLVLEMLWRGVQMPTETVQTKRGQKCDDEKRQFKKDRFVLGITEQDISTGQRLSIRLLTSLEDVLKDTTPITIPVGTLIDGSVPRRLQFGKNAEVSLNWEVRCIAAGRYGMPQ